jgi:hypothetical protein
MSASIIPARASAAEIAEALDREVSAAEIARAIAAALTAETINKAGVRIVDHRSRLEAARLALAYRVGLPVQRTESVTVNLDADSSVGITDRLAKSPALCDQLRKALAEADAAAVPVDKLQPHP